MGVSNSGYWLSFRSTLFLVSMAAAFLPGSAAAQETADCSSCHDHSAKVQKSAHSAVTCQTCHEKHEAYPHPANLPKPACGSCHSEISREQARGVHGQAAAKGNAAAPDCAVCHGSAHEVLRTGAQDFRKAVPDTCGTCHGDINEHFRASVHGKAVARGIMEAPVCTDCHGEHSILSPESKASPVHATHIRETCGRCHGDVRLSRKFGLPPDRITSFDASFHGLAERGGSQSVANCASCHGFHDILSSTDPKSTTHAKNLPATCGKCHTGAGTRFALGTIHWTEGGKEPPGVRWARLFYLFVIPATLGFMVLHHGGNWFRKLLAIRFRAHSVSPVVPAAGPYRAELRMYGAERVQHILLVASFSILVWSGFALKYPDSWWARPILAWESNWPVRGTIHRISAVVMVGVALAHVVTLFVSKRLREHWLHLWPGWRDVVEAVQMLAYNVGLRSNRPVPGAHSYVEKLEYWAVVWGTVVMGLTGFLLWGNRLALAWLPKVWLDLATTVHFYEALLATLSIVVWHFYTVIFDPDVYPMDPAWLTGYSVRRRIAHASEKQFDRRLVTDPTGGLEAATPIQDRATHDNTESPVG